VIGQLLAAPPDKGELRSAIEALAARTWQHPTTGEPVYFGFSTIERWYYRALKERAPEAPVEVTRAVTSRRVSLRCRPLSCPWPRPIPREPCARVGFPQDRHGSQAPTHITPGWDQNLHRRDKRHGFVLEEALRTALSTRTDLEAWTANSSTEETDTS
jgi:hypothetical protein